LFCQNDSRLEFKANLAIQHLRFHENSTLDILRNDGSSGQKFFNENLSQHFVPSLKLEGGYRFSEQFGFGLRAGLAFYIDYWAPVYFIKVPQGFRAFPLLGLYAEYHFNDLVSILGTTNINRYRINSKWNYSTNGSVGIGTQINFGQHDLNRGIRFLFEYGFGGQRYIVGTSDSDDMGKYTVIGDEVKNYMFLFEIGLVVNINRETLSRVPFWGRFF
jgi:hypothetical protein